MTGDGFNGDCIKPLTISAKVPPQANQLPMIEEEIRTLEREFDNDNSERNFDEDLDYEEREEKDKVDKNGRSSDEDDGDEGKGATEHNELPDGFYPVEAVRKKRVRQKRRVRKCEAETKEMKQQQQQCSPLRVEMSSEECSKEVVLQHSHVVTNNFVPDVRADERVDVNPQENKFSLFKRLQDFTSTKIVNKKRRVRKCEAETKEMKQQQCSPLRVEMSSEECSKEVLQHSHVRADERVDVNPEENKFSLFKRFQDFTSTNIVNKFSLIHDIQFLMKMKSRGCKA
nr:hypothetical protein Iba_chr04aCG15110 [Ipomoea batatas]